MMTLQAEEVVYSTCIAEFRMNGGGVVLKGDELREAGT